MLDSSHFLTYNKRDCTVVIIIRRKSKGLCNACVIVSLTAMISSDM